MRRLEYHEVNIQKGAIIGDMRRTKATIGELEDDVKRLTKRLDDIRCEHDETVALVSIQCETLALQEDALQNWRDQIDVFFWVEAIKDAEASRKEYADRYEALLAKWNAFVPEYNEVVAQKNATSAVHQRRVTLRRRACLISIRLTNRYARLPRT